MRLLFSTLIFFSFLLSAPIYAAEHQNAKPLRIMDTRCESQVNPVGIDIPCPRLSWRIPADSGQVAYQIVVSPVLSDVLAGKGSVWNSGIVRSSKEFTAVYAGRRLKSGVRYYWSVRVFNTRGVASAWSRPMWFETLFFSPKEWSV